ncbi:MAG TPA: hypothetical protein VG935_01105, partial [Patescibacteria group bacterium]|nr:hypothetical protein [Patescibacteria group bacterium]
MTTRHFVEIDITLLLFSAFVGAFLAFYLNQRPKVRTSLNLPVVQIGQQPTDTPTPIPSPTAPPPPMVQTFSQISPDGSKTLTMIKKTSADVSMYAFTTTDSPSVPIYTASMSASESMSLPFNAWSPDDKYVFVQHNTASGS